MADSEPPSGTRRREIIRMGGAVAAVGLAGCSGEDDEATTDDGAEPATDEGESATDGDASNDESFVFAEYNIERMNTEQIQPGNDDQLAAAAEVIQRQPEPDVLLICELDNNFQEGAQTETHNGIAFLDNYLTVPQADDLSGVDFEYFYAPESNTGVPSGIDQFKDGYRLEQSDEFPEADDYANDCHGYGEYPGHFAMGIYSKHPIDFDAIRTFRRLRWADMPQSRIPRAEDRVTEAEAEESDEAWTGWFTPAERERFRLSSKTHADIPIEIGGETIHAFITHPTPPGFDGPENMNGRRCYAENRLVADVVRDADYLYDDDGESGGIPADEPFVIMGDLNTEPGEEVTYNVIEEHVFNERVNTESIPTSAGGREAGPDGSEFWTADFEKQADYVLPSTDFDVTDSTVFWPSPDDDPELNELALNASDHFMIWTEVEPTG